MAGNNLPHIAINGTIWYTKGISGRRLFLKYPEIKKRLWKGRLWNSSYYLETVGSVSEEAIKKHIENQSKGGE